MTRQYSGDLQRYAPRLAIEQVDTSDWWRRDWQRFPVYREDLEGELEQPLNVQWAGSLASLGATLRAAGWREPVPLGPSTMLRWLLPAPSLETLPLLPQVHDGRHESLVMMGPPESPGGGAAASVGRNRQPVLRLWRTDTVLGTDSMPLWVGSVSYYGLRPIAFLSVTVNENGYQAALERLMSSLGGLAHRTASRGVGAMEGEITWDGSVLLIRGE